jgi:hypothetical protein
MGWGFDLHDHGGIFHDASTWSKLLDGGRSIQGPRSPEKTTTMENM